MTLSICINNATILFQKLSANVVFQTRHFLKAVIVAPLSIDLKWATDC
jgi:hypothetical protein